MILVALHLGKVQTGDQSIRSSVLLASCSLESVAHYGLGRLLLLLACLDNPCLSIVKVKGIFHLI